MSTNNTTHKKKASKSYSVPKPIVNNNKNENEIDGVSRHASLIRNKSNTKNQSLVRGGSLKETNFLNNWADAFMNIFTKEDSKSSSGSQASQAADTKENVKNTKEVSKKPEKEESGSSRNHPVDPLTSRLAAAIEKDTKEKKKLTKSFSYSSNFMDFFKFSSMKKEKSESTTESPESASKGKSPESEQTATEDLTVKDPREPISTDPAIHETVVNVMATSPSIPIQNTISHERSVEEEPAFSYNSSDLSITSSYLDPLNIPVKDPRKKINLANAILSSSPYYHYDGEEIKPFSFKEENEKPQFLSALAREEPMVLPTNSQLR